MTFNGNPEHLERLKMGGRAWNDWRREQEKPKFEGDISSLFKADLRGADLQGLDLHDANFHAANLQGVNLAKAYLTGCSFFSANLDDANLSETSLAGSNFANCSLINVNFTGASLINVDLLEAVLHGADFNDAQVSIARFLKVDLSNTLNLDKCKAKNGLLLDSHTLRLSRNLPTNFLRYGGLSEDQIRFYLFGNSITIEFTSEKWGQLIPIEAALTATLGDEYIVEKNANRIVIKFESPEQFQQAFEAIVPVLIAIHKISPGSLGGIEAATQGEEETIRIEKEALEERLDTLSDQLDYLVNQERLRQLENPDSIQEGMIELMEEPGTFFIRHWFNLGEQIDEKYITPTCLAIYENYLSIISRLKATRALGTGGKKLLAKNEKAKRSD